MDSRLRGGRATPPRGERFLTTGSGGLELVHGADGDLGQLILGGRIDDVHELRRRGFDEFVVQHHRHRSIDCRRTAISIMASLASRQGLNSARARAREHGRRSVYRNCGTRSFLRPSLCQVQITHQRIQLWQLHCIGELTCCRLLRGGGCDTS